MSESNGKRPADTVKALRIQEVLSLRLNGAEFYDMQAHAREQQWNVSDRTLWRYLAAADELLADSLERDREKLLRRHLAQRRSLYARALQDGDYRTALAVVRDEAELQGLYPDRRLEVSGAKGGPIRLEVIEEVIHHVGLLPEVIQHDGANHAAPAFADPIAQSPIGLLQE